MPTYEYACDKCGEQFDIFQSIKDAPVTLCEKCGGHLTKLLSAGTGLIFKGSGFYITDYKTKTGGEGASGSDSKGSSSPDSSKSSDSSSSSKSESPAASPATAPASPAKSSSGK